MVAMGMGTAHAPQLHRLSLSCISTCSRCLSSGANATDPNTHAARVRSALSAGPLPYERGWIWQQALLRRRLRWLRARPGAAGSGDDGDCLLLFEHRPVYTLGRGASEDHLTFLDGEADGGADGRRRLGRKYRGIDASRLSIDGAPPTSERWSVDEEVKHCASQMRDAAAPVYAPNGAPIYRVERGGEVTYHGPGQLVVYPLLNLKHPASPYLPDLHWYLRCLEEVVIQTLSHFDIPSKRDEINTGVWVGQNKIAAMGVSSARWITTHGLAINVTPNLRHFDKNIMNPCGIEERGVTSMADILGSECPTLDEVAEVVLARFGGVFGIDLACRSSIR